MRILSLLCVSAASISSLVCADDGFLHGWHFIKGDPAGALTATPNAWQSIDIPHTWNADDASHGGGTEQSSLTGYYRGPGWYEKSFETEPGWKGKRVFLRFEGVSSSAEVYLNGQAVGGHRGVATAFVFDITRYLHGDSPNDLRIRADNSVRPDIAPLSGDFPVFGGIYRPVSLLVKPDPCISPLVHASSGVRVSQRDVSKERALVDVKTSIDHAGRNVGNAQVVVRLMDEGREVASASSARLSLAANGKAECAVTLTVAKPHLWNGRKDPHLYHLDVRLFSDGQVVESLSQDLGLRFYRIDPKQGFFLNGEPYMLRGVCRHQDRAGKGWAVTEADLRQDHDLIYDMGARAIRLAHYPHADAFYAMCDRSGLLVWTEIPIVDKISDDPKFAENARQQLTEMIYQLGNHPSIFAWGLSNELFHRPTPDGIPLIKELNRLAGEIDAVRPTTIAVNKQRADLCNITGLLAFNGYPGWYGGGPSGMTAQLMSYNKIGGNRGVGISEYGAGASVKQHEQNPKQPAPASHWHPEEWQSVVHEENWRCILLAKYCWGSFAWNMFDFASVWRDEGDAPGINDKGLVTYDRTIKKDAYFFYQANWSDRPMVHLTSSRHTQRKDAVTPVKVYSNLPVVTLYVNGRKIGDAKPDDLHIARWNQVTLSPGHNQVVVRADSPTKPLVDQTTWDFTP